MVLAVIARPTDIWVFHAHPEVWVLVGGLAACYVYAVRSIGPRAVAPGERVVTRRQWAWFACGLLLLWAASDWPLHDLSEGYLYSAHMVQHMALGYFVPPMLLLATPEWLARLVVGDGRAYRVVGWLSKPVVAGVAFNAVVMITHIPGLVNAAVEPGRANGLLHYGLHFGLVLTSLLMWMPICGPLPERRISVGGKMIYLFAQSIVPTVPAGWLTFAEGAVYKAYDVTPRVWGLSVTEDQQLAGVIMKVGGSLFLWTLTTVLFFRRFMGNWEAENTFRRVRTEMPPSELGGGENAEPALTYEQVAEVFDSTAAPQEPVR
jgi:putative membrane protein